MVRYRNPLLLVFCIAIFPPGLFDVALLGHVDGVRSGLLLYPIIWGSTSSKWSSGPATELPVLLCDGMLGFGGTEQLKKLSTTCVCWLIQTVVAYILAVMPRCMHPSGPSSSHE